MFSKKIIETDFFLEMSPTAKLLYFYLNMSADDDGFVGNPKTIKLISGATDDDLKILIAKQFIIPFDSGVIVIKDWRIHNYIQKDRYNKTQYLEEKSQLIVEENGAYTKCIQNVSKMDTQVRLGKERLGKGAFIPKGAEILGGWAKVYRKDRTYPTETEVSFEEYDNSKIRARVKELTQQGKDITYPVMNSYGKPIGENNWDTMPCVMIRKVALVSAYREAFPAELGSSYEADEIQLDNIPKDVTPQETQEEVRARKMAQIEQMKQEQAQKQTQKADTSYPVDEVSEHTDDPVQGELLDGELEY